MAPIAATGWSLAITTRDNYCSHDATCRGDFNARRGRTQLRHGVQLAIGPWLFTTPTGWCLRSGIALLICTCIFSVRRLRDVCCRPQRLIAPCPSCARLTGHHRPRRYPRRRGPSLGTSWAGNAWRRRRGHAGRGNSHYAHHQLNTGPARAKPRPTAVREPAVSSAASSCHCSNQRNDTRGPSVGYLRIGLLVSLLLCPGQHRLVNPHAGTTFVAKPVFQPTGAPSTGTGYNDITTRINDHLPLCSFARAAQPFSYPDCGQYTLTAAKQPSTAPSTVRTHTCGFTQAAVPSASYTPRKVAITAAKPHIAKTHSRGREPNSAHIHLNVSLQKDSGFWFPTCPEDGPKMAVAAAIMPSKRCEPSEICAVEHLFRLWLQLYRVKIP